MYIQLSALQIKIKTSMTQRPKAIMEAKKSREFIFSGSLEDSNSCSVTVTHTVWTMCQALKYF